jgi:hypothetical protein
VLHVLGTPHPEASTAAGQLDLGRYAAGSQRPVHEVRALSQALHPRRTQLDLGRYAAGSQRPVHQVRALSQALHPRRTQLDLGRYAAGSQRPVHQVRALSQALHPRRTQLRTGRETNPTAASPPEGRGRAAVTPSSECRHGAPTSCRTRLHASSSSCWARAA